MGFSFDQVGKITVASLVNLKWTPDTLSELIRDLDKESDGLHYTVRNNVLSCGYVVDSRQVLDASELISEGADLVEHIKLIIDGAIANIDI
jgi:hypothetical protein